MRRPNNGRIVSFGLFGNLPFGSNGWMLFLSILLVLFPFDGSTTIGHFQFHNSNPLIGLSHPRDNVASYGPLLVGWKGIQPSFSVRKMNDQTGRIIGGKGNGQNIDKPIRLNDFLGRRRRRRRRLWMDFYQSIRCHLER